MTLTKNKIAKQISQEMTMSNHDSKKILECFLEIIKLNIYETGLKIHNFGTFQLKKTPKRMGRNPATLEEIPIKSFKKISFKSSSKVKSSIN